MARRSPLLTFGRALSIAVLVAGVDARAQFSTFSPVSPATPPSPLANPIAATGLIVGRVIAAAGHAAVDGARLKLAGRIGDQRVIADSHGRFVFRDLAKGGFTLRASRSGYAEGAYGRVRPNGSMQSLELVDGQRTTDVTIAMWRFGSISGT